VGFPWFHDEVGNAKLFDEAIPFLLRSVDESSTTDATPKYAQHGQQGRSKLVERSVRNPKTDQAALLQGSWLAMERGFNGYAPGFKRNLAQLGVELPRLLLPRSFSPVHQSDDSTKEEPLRIARPSLTADFDSCISNRVAFATLLLPLVLERLLLREIETARERLSPKDR